MPRPFSCPAYVLRRGAALEPAGLFHEKARLPEIVVGGDCGPGVWRRRAAGGLRAVDGRNASGGDDRRGHSAHDGPAQPGRRRCPLHGHHRLRRTDALGPVEERRRRQGRPGPGRELVDFGGRQAGMDLQASARRSLSRRFGVQCRCGRLEPGQASEPERAAVRCNASGSGRPVHRGDRVVAQDRRQHDRNHHEGHRRRPALLARERLHIESRPVRESGARLEQGRRASIGHGAVETRIVQATRARRSRAQSRLLGQGANSEM